MSGAERKLRPFLFAGHSGVYPQNRLRLSFGRWYLPHRETGTFFAHRDMCLPAQVWLARTRECGIIPRMKNCCLILVFVLGLLIATWAGVAQAQTPVTPEQVNEVAKALWCPLCNGVRLDTCELKACEQMREVIALKLAEGESLDQIRTYFIDQYGPQVLGEPPQQGISWLAWILPFAALVAAGVWVVWLLRRWTRQQPAVATPAGSAASGLSGDQLSRLEEELKKID